MLIYKSIFSYFVKDKYKCVQLYRSVDYIACLSNPCQNNGTCRQRGTSFNCTCTERYFGTMCEGKVVCIIFYIEFIFVFFTSKGIHHVQFKITKAVITADTWPAEDDSNAHVLRQTILCRYDNNPPPPPPPYYLRTHYLIDITNP